MCSEQRLAHWGTGVILTTTIISPRGVFFFFSSLAGTSSKHVNTHMPFTDRQRGPTYLYCSAANRKTLSIPIPLLRRFCQGEREGGKSRDFKINKQKHSTHPRLKWVGVKANPSNSLEASSELYKGHMGIQGCQEPFKSSAQNPRRPLFCNQTDSIPKILSSGLHDSPKQKAGRVYLFT